MLGGKWLLVKDMYTEMYRKWIWDWFDLFEHILWMSTQFEKTFSLTCTDIILWVCNPKMIIFFWVGFQEIVLNVISTPK